jgi:AraC family transcriptional regulator of adaptative response / DNA-3-methyladenine glycosylase II
VAEVGPTAHQQPCDAGGSGVELEAEIDLDWTLGFLAARVAPAVERIGATRYRRGVRWGGAAMALDVGFARCESRPHSARLTVRSAPELHPEALVRLVRHVFDLDADLPAFRALAARDALLQPLVARRPALRTPRLLDPFEGLLRAILGQQVSVAAATTLAERLVRLAGDPAPELDGETLLCFPTAERVAGLDEAQLLGLGLTRSRAATVLATARAVASGELPLAALVGAPAAEIDRALTGVRGIGPWTAAYVRMRALGDRDAFPASDLGVIKAMRLLAGIDAPRRIAAHAERWRPWRAYATLHLWASLGG